VYKNIQLHRSVIKCTDRRHLQRHSLCACISC